MLLSNQTNLLENQISALKKELNSATKNSAGDKHEITRAMIHLEQEKLGIQLQNIQNRVLIFKKINIEDTQTIQMGSIVVTDKGLFFIAVALGKISFQGRDCYVISPISPIGQKMLNLTVGDSFMMNSKYSILNII